MDYFERQQRPEVREAAQMYQRYLGAVSADDPSLDWEADPCAIRDEEYPLAVRRAVVHKAHLERTSQHHGCRQQPENTRAGDEGFKAYCMRLNARGELECRLFAPWQRQGSMLLVPDPKKPSYLKWAPVRTHGRLNGILQQLIPCDADDIKKRGKCNNLVTWVVL